MIGELLYIDDEHSLSYEPFNSNVGVSIMCGAYTSLDTICETGIVVHISGLNDKHSWIPMNVKMPNAIKGELVAIFEKPPIKGTGIDYDRDWNTYHNDEEGCLCIGDLHTFNGDNCIEFASGIVAVLRGDKLASVWAKIKEI
jgi:hypothetical protein